MSARTRVEVLRPAAMQSKPVRVEHVFDDPDAVVDEIKRRAPYPTMSAFHELGGSGPTLPWFRTTFDDPLFLQNDRWVEAAKRSFSAEIVQPLICVLNLNTATPIGASHVDLPTFRGFSAPTVPVWLLMNMAYSGLFNDWMVPFASPIGTPADQARFQNLVEYHHELHWADERWEVRSEGDFVAADSFDNVRISLLWKARVFVDEDHLASFHRTEMNLTTDEVVDLYLCDLERRGVRAERPADPFTDPDWQSLLSDVYRPALSFSPSMRETRSS